MQGIVIKINGDIERVDLGIPTPEEITAMQAEAERAEAEYWANIPYDTAVNSKIREKYTESQEFSILRQKDDKPIEYAEYYAYCEECKAFVKAKKQP